MIQQVQRHGIQEGEHVSNLSALPAIIAFGCPIMYTGTIDYAICS